MSVMGILFAKSESLSVKELADAAKKEIRAIRENYKVIGNEFLTLTQNLEATTGCWNVGISNRITGESRETQGDLRHCSWSEFFEWLLDDMAEAGIGHIKDLDIDYIEWAEPLGGAE